MQDAASNLAASVRQIREIRGWTQQKLSDLSGVPRATLAGIESGSSNPTLAVLVRIAAAFGVSLDELVSPPRASARVYSSSELTVRKRGAVQVRALVPDAIPGVIVERMRFVAGGRLAGTPHKPGTREYLTCESGSVDLIASGQRFSLQTGDVCVFRGDQRHGYENTADGVTVAYSVVLPGA